jgi:hypothetical protein
LLKVVVLCSLLVLAGSSQVAAIPGNGNVVDVWMEGNNRNVRSRFKHHN